MEKIIQTLKELNAELKRDGFLIVGIFGSVARGEEGKDSDVDLLYRLEEPFFQKYGGFYAFKRLEEIKQLIKKSIGKEIDFAPFNNLSKTAQKHIIDDVIYV